MVGDNLSPPVGPDPGNATSIAGVVRCEWVIDRRAIRSVGCDQVAAGATFGHVHRTIVVIVLEPARRAEPCGERRDPWDPLPLSSLAPGLRRAGSQGYDRSKRQRQNDA